MPRIIFFNTNQATVERRLKCYRLQGNKNYSHNTEGAIYIDRALCVLNLLNSLTASIYNTINCTSGTYLAHVLFIVKYMNAVRVY